MKKTISCILLSALLLIMSITYVNSEEQSDYSAVIYCDSTNETIVKHFYSNNALSYDSQYPCYVYVRDNKSNINFMTDGWTNFVNPVTLVNSEKTKYPDSLYVPAGKHTLYFIDNGDNTLTLSYDEPLQDYYILGESFQHDLRYFAKGDSTVYNPELAHLMMTFANAAYDPVKVEQGYLDLGLSQYKPYNYDKNYSVYGTENVCYSIASTVDDEGTICLLVALRGSGSIADVSQGTMDWLGNLELASASETNFKPHNNFNTAAEHVYDGIKVYLQNEFGKAIEDGGVKYFITGHSRGAAVANLVEYKLEPKVGKQNLYGYQFAVPDTGVVSKGTNVRGFDNIFNISNLQDPVSYLPGRAVDIMFSLKQWLETGTLDNEWRKWGVSAWFGGGNIDPSAHDPQTYLEYMRQRKSLSSYTETPKIHLGAYINPLTPWKLVNFKIYATYCPVDVELVDVNGKVIASVIDGVIDYHDSHFGDVMITTVDDHKMFAVPADSNYTLRMVGSDAGTLDYYAVSFDMISEEVSSVKAIEGVELTNGKEMISVVADHLSSEDTQLFVVDENNEKAREVLADGSEVNPIFVNEDELELWVDDRAELTADSLDVYRWYSTDESVATVKDGVASAVAVGEANIIAETVNGARAICKVVVKPLYLGDADGDGIVSIVDATMIQRYLASFTVTVFVENAADTDEDGTVSIVDATAIQRHLAHLPTNENIGKPIK